MKVRGKAGNVKSKNKGGSGGGASGGGESGGGAANDPTKSGPPTTNPFGKSANQPPKGKPNYGANAAFGGRTDQSFRAPGGRGGGSGK
ncbi:MAG: hypothetical protein ACREJO_02870 [Phycisphaerales bacterium]